MGFFDNIVNKVENTVSGAASSNLGQIGLSMIPGVGQYLGAQSQNAANAQSVAQQEAYQTQMSNTAHQREVADLKAAGLNPILSSMGGSGASTPSGSTYQAQNTLSGMGATGSSALGLLQQKQQLDIGKEQLTKAENEASTSAYDNENAADKTVDYGLLTAARQGLDTYMDKPIPTWYKEQAKTDILTNKANQSSARAEMFNNQGKLQDSKFHQDHNTLDNWLDRAGKAVGIGAQGASMITPGIKLQTHFQNSAGSIRVNPKTGEILP